ncbi:MAG: hypothetical protein Q8928_13805 [Bacteroidota bacterium]|nr:hypothetical protein [Bacteroidota bacterium]
MKYLLVIIQLVFVSFNALSQNHKPCPCDLAADSVFSPKLIGTVYYQLFGIIGTEFFNKAYVRGNIVLTNDDTARNINMRYNGRIDGLLYWPQKSGSEILLDKSYIKEFSLEYPSENSKSVFQRMKIVISLTNDSSEHFCQRLYLGNLSLFAYRQCVLAQIVNEYVGKSLVAKSLYEPKIIYYFKLPNNRTIGFKRLNRRSLSSIFPKDKELLKSVLKKLHQRRFRKEEDFIKLASALNQAPEIFN